VITQRLIRLRRGPRETPIVIHGSLRVAAGGKTHGQTHQDRHKSFIGHSGPGSRMNVFRRRKTRRRTVTRGGNYAGFGERGDAPMAGQTRRLSTGPVSRRHVAPITRIKRCPYWCRASARGARIGAVEMSAYGASWHQFASKTAGCSGFQSGVPAGHK
jgi:hypothetical protein